jgi:ABC-type sulfate/molybdate transport systems ATPase subunit
MGAVLKLRGVRHRRGGREVLAVDGLELAAGERLAVLGPNGAGKTSLLRLLAALDEPTAGDIEMDGVPLDAAGLELRRRIGYATQRPGLLSTSVIRNVELPLDWRGIDREERRRAALAALRRVGVESLADRKALSLSGGEAQRVSLARALAIEPRLLLLDEPAAGLDAEARRAFFDDLEHALAERTTTLVHVSHRAEEALRVADRVAVLVGGRLRQLGDPAAVVRRPADATVARLLGYENVLPAEIDASGRVLLGGKPCSVPAPATANAGPATLAAWAQSVRIVEPDVDALGARVERVSPGPGRWEIVLAADALVLHAHMPLDREMPEVGARVGVMIDRGARLCDRTKL